MGRPRNADAAQTRRRILDAAIRRFGSEGLKATSLRKIGGDAGVSFATVHYYFGCKSTLYESCLDASYQELEGLRAALLETMASTEGGVEEKLGAIARRAFFFAREHATQSRFLLRATLYEEAGEERTGASQREYLEVASELLAPVLGRAASELRVPLQGLMFLLTRFAVMSDEELAAVSDGRDAEDLDEVVGDYVARVATATLL